MKSAMRLLYLNLVLLPPIAMAQTTTQTQSAPPPLQANIGPATIAPSTTTTHTQPGTGAVGPIPGTQRGSTTDTSYGVTVTIPMPGGNPKKK